MAAIRPANQPKSNTSVTPSQVEKSRPFATGALTLRSLIPAQLARSLAGGPYPL